MSFMLENLAKPVVFTGSQIPIGVLRTDGRENLITAIEIAGAHIGGRPEVPEVSLYFQNCLFRANRTTKRSSEDLSAFWSYNYPALAARSSQLRGLTFDESITGSIVNTSMPMFRLWRVGNSSKMPLNPIAASETNPDIFLIFATKSQR